MEEFTHLQVRAGEILWRNWFLWCLDDWVTTSSRTSKGFSKQRLSSDLGVYT